MIELEESIETLYSTFARYPKPSIIKACPCGCTNLDKIAPLLAAPLRQLPLDDLGYYSFKAMTTVGSADDFRYFLPRLFQGVVAEEYSYNDEILFGKLGTAKWTTWQSDEVEAVRAYLHALWRRALMSFPLNDQLPAFFEIETLLASIAATGEALEPYLRVWDETSVQAADEHLIQFVTIYGVDLVAGDFFERAFWERSKEQANVLRKWLQRAETLQRVRDKAHLLKNDGFEHLFAPAFDALQRAS